MYEKLRIFSNIGILLSNSRVHKRYSIPTNDNSLRIMQHANLTYMTVQMRCLVGHCSSYCLLLYTYSANGRMNHFICINHEIWFLEISIQNFQRSWTLNIVYVQNTVDWLIFSTFHMKWEHTVCALHNRKTYIYYAMHLHHQMHKNKWHSNR